VSELSSPALPAWVYKRDGRLVPFEADKISQALFAAGESLGRPDAFLARELTDGVLHFLAAETAGGTPTTAQVAELAAKVVRELGHPALAQAFSDAGQHPRARAARPASAAEVPFRFDATTAPAIVSAACLRAYSLHAVFARDLVSAQADGLLTLAGLEAPAELAACVLGAAAEGSASPPGEPAGLFEGLAEARAVTGDFVAVDGPEYALGKLSAEGDLGSAYADRLGRGLRAAGLRAIVNLNCATPPAWAEDEHGGPLFTSRRAAAPESPAAVVEALLTSLAGRGQVWVEWHLGERDFAATTEGRPAPSLLAAARVTAAGLAGITFDRPRRPVALGPGVGRKHPAMLLAVGLHLPRLADLPGAAAPERFLDKLGSLARLALSAASQKRAFLRRHSRAADGTVRGVGRGFLLDRACLLAVPVGLEAVVRRLSGHGLSDGKPGLELAGRILQRLRAVLQVEGVAAGLDICLDGTGLPLLAAGHDGPAELIGLAGLPGSAETATGPTPWDPAAPLKGQVRAAGVLHALTDGGTAALVLPRERDVSGEELLDLLRYAWRQTDVARLRLLRVGQPEQRTFPGL
jgi:hypothetical protein